MAEDSGEKVPLWIISFADMITLLLAFFVMLQTMAQTKDATLFGASRDSFRRSISGLGIPDLLFGKESGPKLDYRKLKYPTEEETEPVRPARIIDADDDGIRKLFAEMSKQMEGQTSDAEEQVLHMTPAAVTFNRDGGVDAAGREMLAGMAAYLQQNLHPESVRVYAIGLARDKSSPREQWLTSARRADSSAKALKELLGGAASPWTVQAWGSGSSQQVLQSVGQVTEKTTIVVVVMETKANGG